MFWFNISMHYTSTIKKDPNLFQLSHNVKRKVLFCNCCSAIIHAKCIIVFFPQYLWNMWTHSYILQLLVLIMNKVVFCISYLLLNNKIIVNIGFAGITNYNSTFAHFHHLNKPRITLSTTFFIRKKSLIGTIKSVPSFRFLIVIECESSI